MRVFEHCPNPKSVLVYWRVGVLICWSVSFSLPSWKLLRGFSSMSTCGGRTDPRTLQSSPSQPKGSKRSLWRARGGPDHLEGLHGGEAQDAPRLRGQPGQLRPQEGPRLMPRRDGRCVHAPLRLSSAAAPCLSVFGGGGLAWVRMGVAAARCAGSRSVGVDICPEVTDGWGLPSR